MLRTSHTAKLAARGRTSLLRGQRTDSRRANSRGIYSHLAHFEPLESRQLLTATVIQVTTTADTVDPADGVISLREAILEANASPADNEIQLPAGTYTLTRKGANEDGALTGDLDIVNNGSLKIVGASSGTTTIDASGLFDAGSGSGDSIFHVLPKPAIDHVLPNSVVEFQGLTFTNAKANGLGGAIKAKQSQMTIVDCDITNSTSNAASGGVVYLEFGSLEINNTNFSNNTGGGALVVRNANAQLLGCTFADNTGGTVIATSNPHTPNTLLIENSDFLDNSIPSDGGAIVAVFIDASIRESRFERNVASYGGAIAAVESDFVLENTTLAENTAISGGGGIFGSDSAVTVLDSSIARNVAGSFGGGGILFHEGHGRQLRIIGSTIEGNHTEAVGGGVVVGAVATVENSTISGNSASQSGGGLIGYWTVRNSTITGNRADSDGNGDGSGGGIWSPGGAGGLTIFNSIVVGNVTGLAGADIANDLKLAQGTAAPTSTFNLIGDPATSGGLVHGTNGNIVGDGNGHVVDIHTVLDTTLADNGGPTLTHTLVLGSPAFNAGDPQFDPNATNPPINFDQRGAGFARVQNGRLDIGAFEGLHDPAPVDGLIFVTTLDDVIDSEDGLWSLREAVIYANTHAEDNVIQLAAGTYHLTRKGANEDGALTGDLDVLNNGSLTIIGASSATTTIDASGLFDAGLATGDRAFEVFDYAEVRFERLTITGGQSQRGAGISASKGLIEIADCNILNNSSPGTSGGGICVDLGSLLVVNTTIAGNSARTGGGIYSGSSVTLTVVGSVISGNTATSSGGGILANTQSAFNGYFLVSLKDTIFSHNSVSLASEDGIGGGLAFVSNFSRPSVEIANCVFEANQAYNGAAFFAANAYVTVDASRFIQNTTSSAGILYAGNGTLTVTNSEFADNVGSGIYTSAETTIVGCTFTNNSATPAARGGGIYGFSTLTVRSSTISGNTAIRGG